MLVHSVVLPPITYDNQVMYRFLHTRINKQRIYNHITCLHLTWMSYDKGMDNMFLRITHSVLFARLEYRGKINMKHLKQYNFTKVEHFTTFCFELDLSNLRPNYETNRL